MNSGRTKRLTIDRVLKILQLRYGTQVQKVIKHGGTYIVDSILCEKREFSRNAILTIEDEMYSVFSV